METEQSVNRAKNTLHNLLQLNGKRHARIHMDAQDQNAERLRALEGICGDCRNLVLAFHRQDGKEMVTLRCNAMHSIVTLYQSTPYGEQAKCPDHKPREDQGG